MRPHRSLARLAALTLTAAMMLGGAACSLVAGLDKLTFTDAGACGDACDDENPCTEADCVIEGACHGTPIADGPAPSNPSGDCKQVVCAAGVAKVTVDDADLPADDHNPCTDERCEGGAASHAPRSDGEPCVTLGKDGVCNAGACAAKCAVDVDCDDQNPCSTEACDPVQLFCVTTLLDGVPTPGAMSTPGDCHARACVVGADTDVVDATDVPTTLKDCLAPACVDGAPTLPPKAQGEACSFGGGQVCDGDGSCVECNVAADCAKTNDECKLPACKANKTCGVQSAPAGTPLSMQMKGNCQAIVCDGAGETMLAVDDLDVPDDGNTCTDDTCAQGVPANPPGPVGAPCGVAQACNAAGKCGCTTDAQCVAPDTCGGGNPGTQFTCGCTKKSCGTLGKTCGLVTDGCSGTQNCNSGSKNGNETDVDCGGGGNCATTCAAGKLCAIDTDCTSGHCADGVCCNTACAGACTACNLAGALGTCLNVAMGSPDPVTCIAPNLCDGAGVCKKPNGQACTLATQCTSGACSDGVCCNTTCKGTCTTCNLTGFVGTCSNVLMGQVDANATTTCVAPSVCNGGGLCKLTAGQPCTLASQCLSGSCSVICQ